MIGGSQKWGSAGYWGASLGLQVPKRACGIVTFIFTVYLLWAPHAGWWAPTEQELGFSQIPHGPTTELQSLKADLNVRFLTCGFSRRKCWSLQQDIWGDSLRALPAIALQQLWAEFISLSSAIWTMSNLILAILCPRAEAVPSPPVSRWYRFT